MTCTTNQCLQYMYIMLNTINWKYFPFSLPHTSSKVGRVMAVLFPDVRAQQQPFE